MKGHVGHDRLAKDETRKYEEINAMDGAIDDLVACDAKNDK